ncbi:MAG: His-Xaa-Ser system protein HxsD [Bacteroidales bacterium]|nr:His-Xaa-Ser system protein HxsD [Bacteroidales bacterium]
MKLNIDLKIYEKDVVTSVLYNYLDLYYITQGIDNENPDLLNVVFESKENTEISEELSKQISNNLIEEQLRFNINKQFGYIRNLIVEEAFKPINSK